MANKRPICRSKTIPCPASERYLQHRELLNAILVAAEGKNLEEFRLTIFTGEAEGFRQIELIILEETFNQF